MSQELPRSLPCLDIQAGIRQLEGNQELYLRLLKKFAECNHNLAEQIADKLANTENEQARILAHSTKGVSGSIGATELFLASAALETAVTRGKTGYALQEFSAVLDTVLQSIEALVRNRDAENLCAEEKNPDMEILLPMLEELETYLQAGDFKALE
ncbi:MAG: Hpt domain-containing protein, partial [Candidatus Electrothrix sp. EH2]|nr:Hpt domain-containing protein [Candidatus Electrothrix sp. EH2]